MKKDYIVAFSLFAANYNGFKTMYRHFNNLEKAKLFANNVNIKNNCRIYESINLKGENKCQ